jgi:RNA polymerase sigma factor (sigma-70 family)
MPELPDATRHSLVERLANWDDRERWQEFFDTYWRLIYAVARRAGLQDSEAQDVVQETILAVARNITKYERSAGRFKPWLLQMTRWRIADQFRKRLPEAERVHRDGESARNTATMDRFAAPGADLEEAWETEWQERLLEAALQRLKRKVKPQHFQVFDCIVRKHWPAAKIARELGLNIAQVYLIKHRLAGLLKKEVRSAEAGGVGE